MEESISLDSDSEEPSPEALARYLTMRRHTVEIAHPQNEATTVPADTANYFAQHHHYQPGAAAGPFLHPPMFVPCAVAGHGLPHNVFMPQDLSVYAASEDTASSTVADSHLLRPPQTSGIIIITIILR